MQICISHKHLENQNADAIAYCAGHDHISRVIAKKSGNMPAHPPSHVAVSKVPLDSALNCKTLLHVTGPNWPHTKKIYKMKTYQSRSKMLLRDAVWNVLNKAREMNLQSISLAPLC